MTLFDRILKENFRDYPVGTASISLPLLKMQIGIPPTEVDSRNMIRECITAENAGRHAAN